jgi:hypothetical protein
MNIIVRIFLLSLYVISLTAQAPLTPTEFIQNGTGWAKDLLSIANANCYNPATITVGATNTQEGMQESTSAAAIAAAFGIQTNLSVAFSIFQSTSLYNYLNNKTENIYTLTANYYYIISSEVQLTYEGQGLDLLNSQGAQIYDLGKNPAFRNLCGNILINAYTVGAAILTSVSLTFATQPDMLAMQAQLSTGFGPYANVLATINTAAQQAGVQCDLLVSAQQYGGNDIPLSLIMSINTGNCVSSNTTVCAPLITAVNNYILEDFVTQGESGISPIPLGGVTLGDNIDDCGLDPGPSVLTLEVVAAQYWIMSTLLTYQDMYNALIPIMYSEMTLDDNFFQELTTYYSNLQYSYIWISTGGTMTFTPQNCFAVDPTNCPNSQLELMSTLEPYEVTSGELTALFQSIEYIYQINCAFNFTLYPLGNWDYIYQDVNFTASTRNFALQNGSFIPGGVAISTQVNAGSFDYEEYNNDKAKYQTMQIEFNLNSEDEGELFEGDIAVYDAYGNIYNYCPGSENTSLTIRGSINPYFFNFTEIDTDISLAAKTGFSIIN